MDTFGLRLWMDAKGAIRKHQSRFLSGTTDSSDAEKRFLPRLWRGFFCPQYRFVATVTNFFRNRTIGRYFSVNKLKQTTMWLLPPRCHCAHERSCSRAQALGAGFE